jgi:hypothetical protein
VKVFETYMTVEKKIIMKEYKRNDMYILRIIMGKYMLFPVNEHTQNFQGAVLLNDIAVLLWNEMEHYVTKTVLLNKIVTEYDVEVSQAEADLQSLLDMLVLYSIVEECDTSIK